MKNFMFDTNIFNDILDGKHDLSALETADADFWATHIQEDEIRKTGDEERKTRLLKVFKIANKISTSSGIWGVSKWGQCKYSDGKTCTLLKDALDKRNKRKSNNIQDALIAETALKNDFALVTHDSDLYYVFTKECNRPVINLHALSSILGIKVQVE